MSVMGILRQLPFMRSWKSEQFCTVLEKQMSDHGAEGGSQGFRALPFRSSAGRSYEHLPNSVHRSNGCLDIWLDWFSRNGWVDSYSPCLCRGVARFAFRSRQTRGSRPANHEMIPYVSESATSHFKHDPLGLRFDLQTCTPISIVPQSDLRLAASYD